MVHLALAAQQHEPYRIQQQRIYEVQMAAVIIHQAAQFYSVLHSQNVPTHCLLWEAIYGISQVSRTQNFQNKILALFMQLKISLNVGETPLQHGVQIIFVVSFLLIVQIA